MAGKHYFGDASVSLFASSSESEDGWTPDLSNDVEAMLRIDGYPTPGVINGEDVMICEDLTPRPSDAASEVAAPSYINRRVPAIVDHERPRSVDVTIGGPVVNSRNSPPPAGGRSSSVGAARAGDDGASEQLSRVVLLDGTDGAQACEMQTDDSGYETMSVEPVQDDAETKTEGADTTMDAVETGEETDAAGRGVNSIIIYCVCCSKQVESPASLKNRLCKACIDILADDAGVMTDGSNDTVSNTLGTPCAVCSKHFEKSVWQPQQMCKRCIAIVLEDCEKEQGVETDTADCSCCHNPFTRNADNLYDTLCPRCKYVSPVQPLREQLPCRVQRRRPEEHYPGWGDNAALQGCTAIIVKAHLRNHFYKWCDGHRTDNEAQEAHQCLAKSYAVDAARMVCNALCPYMVVRMIKSMPMGDCLRLGGGAEIVVSKALWAIQSAADPFLKMKDLKRGAPVYVRSHIGKVVVKWGNRLCPVRHRGTAKPLRRKLTY